MVLINTENQPYYVAKKLSKLDLINLPSVLISQISHY